MKVMNESTTLGELAAEGLKEEGKRLEEAKKENKRLRRENRRLRKEQRKRSREAMEKILKKNKETAEELGLIDEELRLIASGACRQLCYDEEEEEDEWKRMRDMTLMRWERADEESAHANKKARSA